MALITVLIIIFALCSYQYFLILLFFHRWGK